MKYKNKAIFVGSLTGFIIACAVFFKIFEPIATGNIAVNFSKRIVAETGNLAANIYDPYKKTSRMSAIGPVITPTIANLAEDSKDLESGIIENRDLKAILSIVQYDNDPLIRSFFEFNYQTYDEKKLNTLSAKYGLKEKTSLAGREFEKIILIREWLNSYMKFGTPHDVFYNFDAFDILERAGKGEVFFCSEYAATFIELLASIGITARYVGLFKGHAVSEVWSDDYGKWLIMDPTYNIYYEMGGMPLNALELHNAWVNGKWKDVKIVMNRNKEIDKYPYKLIDYYADFFIRMRNDWLTNHYPRWHPKSNSIMNGLEWSDAYTKNDIRIATESGEIKDFYWNLNQVYIKLVGYKILNDKVVLTVYLDTVTPNFKEFLIKLGKGNDEIRTVQPIFDWQLEPGVNKLEVASFNKFDIKGKLAIIYLDYR